MSRNVESRFAENPTRLDMSRSTFDRNSSIKLTFNAGDLIPFYVDEVLPGDTFQIKTSKVVRMQSLITPLMDNMYLDTYWHFVPARLCWSHWREFMGENTQSAWVPQVEYQVPQVSAPRVGNGWDIGTIADYMGIPTGVQNFKVNALPFRAYALICNEWFRDENLTDPLVIPLGDALTIGSNGDNYLTDVAKGGKPFKVSKYHDYFTSCLPAPQKGPDVTLPIASGGMYPVVTGDAHDYNLQGNSMSFFFPGTSFDSLYMLGEKSVSTLEQPNNMALSPNDASAGIKYRAVPDNLYALEVDPASATINQLRMAFQIQKFYERDARGGTRYIELLKSHFGVTSPDARLQRPEYLGGNRIPINVNQIVQQSETGTTPQGTPTGLSLTTDLHGDFIKSFVEHGFVIGVMCVRYDHSYQQGLDRFWSRKGRFDYYWPAFANLGEMAVLNREIYLQSDDVMDADGAVINDKVFGYQEAWADYRYKPSRVAGEMRSQYAQSLDVWHLADDYSALPTLSDAWIREDSTNVNRVIAVSEQQAHQFFADIYVQNRTTRPMPMYSIPGLIDHH